MSKIDTLLKNYSRTIAIPWRDVAAAQRVIFAVYPQTDELKIRARLDEFELVTQSINNGKHAWFHYDLTDTFAKWMFSLKYSKSYYEKPHLLGSVIPKYLLFIENEFNEIIQKQKPTSDDIVALSGVGTIFGFAKVRDLVDKLAPKVNGRLLVFFPGSYENNKYSLLDAYDGWDYHAEPIPCDREI